MEHAVDLHRGDRGSLNRREQHATQAVADGGAESALEGLRGKPTEPIRERLPLEIETLGTLKAFPKHGYLSFRQRAGSSGLQTCMSSPPASRRRSGRLRAGGLRNHTTKVVGLFTSNTTRR